MRHTNAIEIMRDGIRYVYLLCCFVLPTIVEVYSI